MSELDEERADEAASHALPTSSNGEVDLLDSAAAAASEAQPETNGEATNAENEEEEFHDTAEDLSNEENENILTDDSSPNIASVTALVNEIRGINTETESPLLSQKIEAMEQGSRYRDDPNSDESDLHYYSTSSPPAGVWSSSQRPQLRSGTRYNFIGSFIRSKTFTYCAIVSTLVAIAIGISAAVTKGFEHTQHRNDLLHPKWENDEVIMPQEDLQQLDGEAAVWIKNPPDTSDNEGSIMQVDISSLPSEAYTGEQEAEVYTDKQDGLDYQLANTYIPIWFSRETGWNGSNHAEAMEFCNSRDDTSLVFAPCPYDVYCPGGKKKLIFNEEADEAVSWAPVLEANKWVQVGSGGNVCESMVIHDLGEQLTRHIMCCLETPLVLNVMYTGGGVQSPPNVEEEGGDGNVDDPIPPPPMTTVSSNNVGDGSVGSTLPSLSQSLVDKYHPHWFSDEFGWSGTTYDDAKKFCEFIKIEKDQDDTYQLCPLDVYCPYGPIDDKPLYFDMDAFEGEQWAPIGDENERWVVIGNSAQQTCVLNPFGLSVNTLPSTVKKHIMCCQVPDESPTSASGNNNDNPEVTLEHYDYEGESFKELNPVWFGTDEWISGSHDDALHFCNFKGKALCPYAAYCPDGPGKHPVDGWVGTKEFEEQWAPISQPNHWVLIGAENNNPFSQCKVTDSPSFGFDKSQPELKLHIMCCDEEQSDSSVTVVETPNLEPTSTEKPESSLEQFDFEASVLNELNPVWYSSNDDEWNSGSYGDAMDFCNIKGKALCPYAAYCPYGPGKHPVDGWVATKEFEEQWAPISQPNHWVLIGAENNNPFSQCKVTDSPSFGFDKSQPELKLHIMCCDEEQSKTPTLEASSSAASTSVNPIDESSGPESSLPVWFDRNDGWYGEGYDSAISFCLGKQKTLCPVEMYCPNGPTRAPFQGSGGSSEIEQWAPASDKENYWIMIGFYEKDEKTICQDQEYILGGYPPWGLDGSFSEHKQHILCCPST